MIATAATFSALLACGSRSASEPRPPATPAPTVATAPTAPKLPSSKTVTATPPAGLHRVVVTTREITVDDGACRVPLAADRTTGVDSRFKEVASPMALLVPQLVAALSATRAHEAALEFDGSTPYRVVVETLFSAGQAEVTVFHILVTTDRGVGDIRTFPPRAATWKAPANPERHLFFTVVVSTEGVSLRTRGGNIAPGCKSFGSEVTVPKKAGAHDWAMVRECAIGLRNANPEADEDLNVTVSATNEIPFADVVSAIDAVRVDYTGAPLFPEISFGIRR